MTQPEEMQIDHNVARAFELLAQRGWVARRTKPGDRGILSSFPGGDWRGVLVNFSFGKLTVHCSGRTAKSYKADIEALQRDPARLAADLEQITNRHRLDEEAEALLFERHRRAPSRRTRRREP